MSYLFYTMPLHLDEQHGGHSVGSLAELLSHEPLRDDSPASESELSALQAVKAGAIVREAMLAQTDAASSQRMGDGATWGAAR